MSAKQFFKSTAFKCIVILLVIMLVCGVLLTLANALLEVSDEERLSRTISAFYGEDVEYEVAEIDENYASTALYEVSQVYDIGGDHEGDYLLYVSGAGGYPNGTGTVVAWVIVHVDEDLNAKVTQVSLPSSDNSSQTFLSYITDSYINSVIAQADESGFTSYTTGGISTGATYTFTGMINCMNGAKSYIESVYCGYVSPYAEYEYTDYIDDSTTISVDGTEVTYYIVTAANSPAQAFEITITVDENKTITAYEITGNGSTADYYVELMAEVAKGMVGYTQSQLEEYLNGDSIKTGATRSNELCVYAGLFATANYDLALAEYGEGGNA